MTQLSEWSATFGHVLLVVVGFGLIIFVHELGHFVAAKWAGIRVLAFAMGFGPAIVSWRKGLGWRRGSSENAYRDWLSSGASTTPTAEGARSTHHSLSPTEYRLNWLPFGGYVKMLGQDDLDPTAVSAAPDSYQNCPVWKRMVVISAGVVMNVLAAAILFVCVYMRGIETLPAKIGFVAPASPASRARALETGVPAGLRAGDSVVSINGRPARSFDDLMTASAMSGRDEAMRIVVDRRGVARPITFEVTPQTSEQTHLMEIGVAPAFGATLLEARSEADRAEFRQQAALMGYPQLEPGMRLVRVGANRDVRGAADLMDAAGASGGAPFEAEFEGTDGKRITLQIKPRAQLQSGVVSVGDDSATVNHLLGLMPLMRVAGGTEPGQKPDQGLEVGDIIARVGAVEFPSTAEGTAEIHRHRGTSVPIDVFRSGPHGPDRIAINPDPIVRPVDKGRIGFLVGDTAETSTLVALPPGEILDPGKEKDRQPAPAPSVITRPGTRILSVGGTPVTNFTEIRSALLRATQDDFDAKAPSSVVELTLELPTADRPKDRVEWRLSRADIEAVHSLGWESPIGLDLFQQEEFLLKAQGETFVGRARDAVSRGLTETQRVMLMTYQTFERLFQGTVKVEHLKGPVGIAHMGTKIADRGVIWLLFFMALISVNLAVVNFLPLPIVDGGQFIFLILEGIRGKPVSVQVQNVATIAGLVLIGTMFLIVTFHDFAALFG